MMLPVYLCSLLLLGSNAVYGQQELDRSYQQLENIQYVTTIVVEAANPTVLIKPSNKERKASYLVLDNWVNGRPSDQKTSSSTEQTNNGIRLDRQETFKENGRSYVNFQLQVNGKKFPSSVAQVNVQEELKGIDYNSTRRMIRMGLKDSLDHGGRVWIRQEVADSKLPFQKRGWTRNDT